jgi:hypothetical protein
MNMETMKPIYHYIKLNITIQSSYLRLNPRYFAFLHHPNHTRNAAVVIRVENRDGINSLRRTMLVLMVVVAVMVVFHIWVFMA